MYKALFKKQLMESFAWLLRRRGKKSAWRLVLLAAALAAVLLASFCAMAAPLGAVLAPRGLGWLYFDIMGLTALLFGTAAASFVSFSALFGARDNELLLALPIPPQGILAVRVLNVFAGCAIYMLAVLLPAEAVWAYCSRQWAALLCAAPFAAALCCVGTVLACLAGWGAAAVSARVKSKSAAAAAVTVLFLGAYTLGFQYAQKRLTALLAEAAQSPEVLRQKAGVLLWLGEAACGSLAALALLLLFAAALLACFCAALAPRYFGLIMAKPAAGAWRENARARAHSVHTALLLRELRHFYSSAAWLVNGAFGWLLAAAAIAAVLLRPNEARALLAQLPHELVPPVVCACLCAAASTPPVAAPSVSLEGRTLWLAKSLPVEPWLLLRAKLELHWIITAPPALLCSVCVAAVGGFSAAETAACLLAAALCAFVVAQAGLCLGLLMPDFNWASEAAVIKRGGASMLAALCGMAVSLTLCALAAMLAMALGSVIALLICAAVLAAAAAVLGRWLRVRGVELFERL